MTADKPPNADSVEEGLVCPRCGEPTDLLYPVEEEDEEEGEWVCLDCVA